MIYFSKFSRIAPSNNETKLLIQQANQIETPPGCHIFAKDIMPAGTDDPEVAFDANYGCSGQLTGAIQDNVDGQLHKLGFQQLPDTTPNPDQVLRAFYQNGTTNVRYTIGSPELGNRKSLGNKLLTEEQKRHEHAAGVDIIFTKR